MTRFDEFLDNEPKDVKDLQKLDGNYGCQSCDEQVEEAYFDEKSLEISWYCSEKHKSSIQLG